MVDAVVSYVVERLGDFLTREVVRLREVKKEVEWLKDELGYMQDFLKDAEEKQYVVATICRWVSDIRELAYDIEDVLDRFHLKVHCEAADDDGGTMEGKPKWGCFPSACSCIFDKGKKQVSLYKMGKEIEEFKNRLNDLSRRRQLYGLQDSGNNRERRSSFLDKLRDIRRVASFSVEKNVVGFHDAAEELLTELLNNEPRRLIISIYGMGGLGKTTLAGKLYHNNNVREKFNYCAWVSVSQDYTTRDLLQRIINSIEFETTKMEDIQKMDEADLGRYLHKSLQQKSYVVVIDDVWDKEAWKSLKRAFPDNENGSRVIITTRSKEVAERSDERTYAHSLRYLRPDESWQLFCERSFQNFNTDEGLENLGREMVEKCNGLPLAIIVLGGLLSRKKPQEWGAVRNHLWQHLKADSIEIHSLLALSFDSLPYQLKPCFLYLGLFPEDSVIQIQNLIHLLVAEGFIPQDEDRTIEEVANDYIGELINRSLIQVGKRSWGRIESCRVHDLLRDLAIEKIKDLNLLHIYDEMNHSNVSLVISSCPRQTIYSVSDWFSWLQKSNPWLRSLIFFSESGGKELPTMCRKFSSLRVLNIGYLKRYDIQGSQANKEIGKLIHLKYLALQLMDRELDRSLIFNLQRLQTLVLYHRRESSWVSLPAEINRLQELRHLIGKFDGGVEWICNLTKLQTLKYVRARGWAQIKTEKFVNLRELWVDSRFDQQRLFSFDSMANLKSLRILVVQLVHYEEYFSSLEPLSHCRHLKDLRLRGRLKAKLPQDIHQVLPNVECLSLRRSALEDDPMPLLERLPSLTILDLRDHFYSGKKMMCSAKGFLRLEILLLEVIGDTIEELQMEEGALPRLRGFNANLPINSKLIFPERLRSIRSPDLMEFQTDFDYLNKL